MKIVIIDDDLKALLGLLNLFRMEGGEDLEAKAIYVKDYPDPQVRIPGDVACVTSSKQVVDEINKFNPDLILIAHYLSGITGDDVVAYGRFPMEKIVGIGTIPVFQVHYTYKRCPKKHEINSDARVRKEFLDLVRGSS